MGVIGSRTSDLKACSLVPQSHLRFLECIHILIVTALKLRMLQQHREFVRIKSCRLPCRSKLFRELRAVGTGAQWTRTLCKHTEHGSANGNIFMSSTHLLLTECKYDLVFSVAWHRIWTCLLSIYPSRGSCEVTWLCLHLASIWPAYSDGRCPAETSYIQLASYRQTVPDPYTE